MTIRQRRVALIATILLSVGIAVALALRGFSENISFYRTPSQLTVEHDLSQHYRVGGLVARHSVTQADSVTHFRITDTTTELAVTYDGQLPDLFREGQGVVVEGRLLPDGSFAASQVLAKHDERYMPPEAARALEDAKAQQAQDTIQGGQEP